tara:strand:- start:3136 stop:3348 length:213 start_codon:yes stop_codon:yes gene_type:complete
MLFLFILNGFFISGNVDLIEGDVAVVEFNNQNGVQYKSVSINKKICVPKEGQRVMVSSNNEIIFCMQAEE